MNDFDDESFNITVYDENAIKKSEPRPGEQFIEISHDMPTMQEVHIPVIEFSINHVINEKNNEIYSKKSQSRSRGHERGQFVPSDHVMSEYTGSRSRSRSRDHKSSGCDDRGGGGGDDCADIETSSIGSDTYDNYSCSMCGGAILACGGIEYQCSECGLVEIAKSAPCEDEEHGANMVALTTGMKNIRYNLNSEKNYTSTQKKNIENDLIVRRTNYKGNQEKFPKWLLKRVAAKYNEIQKLRFMSEGREIKIVRRSDIKSGILAAILFYESLIVGDMLKTKNEIAEYMNINPKTFSKGDNLVRDLARGGHIKLDIDSDSTFKLQLINEFLKNIQMNDTEHENFYFIKEIIDMTEKLHLCIECRIQSKIVGAVWFLVKYKQGAAVTEKELEAAKNSCKKTTFMKFSKTIMDEKYRKHFEPIFKKYNILSVFK